MLEHALIPLEWGTSEIVHDRYCFVLSCPKAMVSIAIFRVRRLSAKAAQHPPILLYSLCLFAGFA